jgi:NAD(P)H-hydrate epimerase
MWIANRDHSKSIDTRSSEEFGISAKVLMERAGLAVFEAVKEVLPNPSRIVVFCGKGNNGGDGFVVARLAKEENYTVICLVAANEDELSTGCAEQLVAARAQGVEAIFPSDERWIRKLDCVGCRDLIVDALLGTGAKNVVHGYVRDAIQAINRSGVPVISVDVPSGIACDTGEELEESVWAYRTVTMGLPKPFLFEGIGLEHSGYWTVADIGYPKPLLAEPTSVRLIDNEWVANLLPERLRSSNKGDNGSVLIVAGSHRMRGAATLAATAAMRAGAGLITVAGIPSVCDAVANQLPEVLLMPLPEHEGGIGADAARILHESQGKFHSAVFGPGMSQEPSVFEFLERVWQNWETPCVIDADALNAVSSGIDLPRVECVLTPHPGEMGRLLKLSIAEVQNDRLQTVRSAIERFRQTVLLKGSYTIVGEDEQPLMVNHSGNAGLASAGMGDVLSGVVATLLAQDLPGYYAASCGMYWHGYAGDVCAMDIGPVGYSAIEVANALPKARVKIVAPC